MSGLNPPPIRIPAKFEQDADLRAYFLDLHTFLRLLFVKASPDGGIEPEDGSVLAANGMANAQRIEVLRQAIEELAATIPGASESFPYLPPITAPFNDFLPSVTLAGREIEQFPPVGGPVTHTEAHYHHSYTVERVESLPSVTVSTSVQDALPHVPPASPAPEYFPGIWQQHKRDELEYISTAFDYTARAFQMIEVTSNKTVTLPKFPDVNEIIYVKSNTAAGDVTVAGNGKNIDGDTSVVIEQYGTLGVVYSGTEWLVISDNSSAPIVPPAASDAMPGLSHVTRDESFTAFHVNYQIAPDVLPSMHFTQEVQDALPAITFISKPDDLEYISTAVNITARAFQFIEVTSNKTVTLPQYPDRNEVVYVKSNTGAGDVTVDGNGKNIDGAASAAVEQYGILGVIYSGSEWLVISDNSDSPVAQDAMPYVQQFQAPQDVLPYIPQVQAPPDVLPLIQYQKSHSQYEYITTAVNYTAQSFQIVECTSNKTITLPAFPDQLEMVVVKSNSAAGDVTISGNGKNIDGVASLTIPRYAVRWMVYSGSQWMVLSNQQDTLPHVFQAPPQQDTLPAINFIIRQPELEYIITAANYTARAFQFVEVTSNKTITLPLYPAKDDVIFVKSNSGAGNVTINGGGKNVDGVSSFTIPQYAVRGMIFNGTEWMVSSK